MLIMLINLLANLVILFNSLIIWSNPKIANYRHITIIATPNEAPQPGRHKRIIPTILKASGKILNWIIQTTENDNPKIPRKITGINRIGKTKMNEVKPNQTDEAKFKPGQKSQSNQKESEIQIGRGKISLDKEARPIQEKNEPQSRENFTNKEV